MVASAVAAAASAATSFGLNKLFGGGSSKSQAAPGNAKVPPVSSGALNIDPNRFGRGFDVSLGKDFRGSLNRFNSLSRSGANQLGRLQSKVAPGFSQFREAGLNRLTSNRQRTVGDLRDDLAARRVLGSSFANDAISRAEAEFGLQEADFEARTILQEIEATANFINQRSQLLLNAAQQEIAANADLAGIAAQLASGVQSNMTALAQTNATIAAQNAAANAQGLGAFFQPTIDAVGTGASNFVTNLMGGGKTTDNGPPKG